MSCPHTKSCAIFPEFKMQSLLRYWIQTYCEADYTRCARFALARDARPIPLTLLPSGRLLGEPESGK